MGAAEFRELVVSSRCECGKCGACSKRLWRVNNRDRHLQFQRAYRARRTEARGKLWSDKKWREYHTAARRKGATYKSPEFKREQAKWYNKLRSTGFKDIEHSEGSPYVKDHWMATSDRVRRGWRTGAEALIEVANDYLDRSIGSRRSERVNIALYLKGMSVEDIAARFGNTARAVKKQVISYMKRVRDSVKADQETEAGSEEETAVTPGEVDLDLPDTDPDA